MVTRRGYLASLAGGTATTTGTATSVITTITNAVFPSREPNARHDDWYGTRTTNRDAYVVDYEYVPVTTRADYDADSKISWTRQSDSATVTVPKTTYDSVAVDMYSGTAVHTYDAFTTVRGSAVGERIASAVLPESLSFPVHSMMRFVQAHEYRSDAESTKYSGYIRHPVEMIVDGVGDCKDTVMLFTALASARGFTVGCAAFTDHLAPVVKRSELPPGIRGGVGSDSIMVGGDEFVVVELTSDAEVGDMLRGKDELIWVLADAVYAFNLGEIPENFKHGVSKFVDKHW